MFFEWVFAVYVGAAYTEAARLSLVQPGIGTDLIFAEVAYRGDSFTPPLYYGYRLSFFPQSEAALGIEAEFIHLKAYAQTDRLVQAAGVYRGEPVSGRLQINDVIQRFSISHGLNLILVNAVARRTLSARAGAGPRVYLIGRVGAGPTLPHPENTVDEVSHDGYELGALALQAAGGLEFRLSGAFAIVAEYKFTRTSQRVTVDRGQARGTFASHHGIVGVAWHSR